MSKRFPIALFGAGRIAHVHARNIADHEESAVRYIVDPFATEAAHDLSGRVAARVVDEDTALGDAELAAIVIASATETHADLIEKGLRAGKAVFCEKPIDLDKSRVEAVVATVKASSVPVFVAFNRRFDPAILDMKRRIMAGEIGTLELVSVISKDPDGGLPIEYLRRSGGLFRDMTIHDFDMARHILGEDPVAVTAMASALCDAEIEAIGDIDTAAIILQTATGKIATITNSRRASFGYDQRVEAHGSEGLLRTENIPMTPLIRARKDGVRHELPMFFFIERYAQSYKNEWAQFIDVLKGEEPPAVTAEDGRRALLLAEAAYESLTTGHRVVPAYAL